MKEKWRGPILSQRGGLEHKKRLGGGLVKVADWRRWGQGTLPLPGQRSKWLLQLASWLGQLCITLAICPSFYQNEMSQPVKEAYWAVRCVYIYIYTLFGAPFCSLFTHNQCYVIQLAGEHTIFLKASSLQWVRVLYSRTGMANSFHTAGWIAFTLKAEGGIDLSKKWPEISTLFSTRNSLAANDIGGKYASLDQS